MSTNPWHAANPYIKYLHTRYPFNKTPLLRDGYQWAYNSKDKEFFHYANYRVNPTIPEKEIKVLEDMRFQNYSMWEVVSIGLPGTQSGSVYSNL